MKLPQNVVSSDDFQTPAYALDPLLPYLNPEWVIWECAVGKGNLQNALMDRDFICFGSDINRCGHHHDFLTTTPLHAAKYDCIVTNPPYSLKNEFLKKCYDLRMPFALLLPLTTFETKKRQALFREHGVEVIFLPKRINFETPSGKGSGSWFATAWFTWGLAIGEQLVFSE